MEEGVRRQVKSRSAIGIAAIAVLGTTLWFSCGEAVPEGPDRTTQEASDLLTQILTRNHGPRQGTFENSIVEFRATPASDPTTCSIGSPDRFRVDYEGDGGHFTIRGNDNWERKDGRSISVSDRRLAELKRMRGLIQALLLLPTYRAQKAEHRGNGQLEFTTGNGETWTLSYAPSNLAVTELSGAIGTVTVHKQHDNGTSFMPILVTVGSLHKYHARIRATDVHFEDATFKRPEEQVAPKQTISFQSSDHPLTPEFQRIKACHLLYLNVGEDWAEIQALAKAAGMRLYNAGQKNAGDPYFVQRDGKRQLVIQYLPRDKHSADEFTPESGESVEAAPRRSAAVLYAAEGEPYAERVKAGSSQLEEFLSQKGVRASGPIRIVINSVFSDIDVPAARRSMDIRLELPIEQ